MVVSDEERTKELRETITADELIELIGKDTIEKSMGEVLKNYSKSDLGICKGTCCTDCPLDRKNLEKKIEEKYGFEMVGSFPDCESLLLFIFVKAFAENRTGSKTHSTTSKEASEQSPLTLNTRKFMKERGYTHCYMCGTELNEE